MFTREEMAGCYLSYPDMTIAAIKQKRFKFGLRYWELLSAMMYFDPDEVQFYDYLRGFIEFARPMSDNNFYKIIAKGDGYFWEYRRGANTARRATIRMYSPEEVAHALGLESPGFVEPRSSAEILGPNYMADVYRALHFQFSKLASPMTRKAFEAFTGIRVRSQQVYDKGTKLRQCW